MTRRAVVFAYHSIGVAGLGALLDAGLEIPLLVTHRDNPRENIWFDSVVEHGKGFGIPVITPDDPNRTAVIDAVKALRPDWLFSFYYRHMLGPDLLAAGARGAYNLHGSLLPKYRGRAPVNWAVLHGERETGVTLHRMVQKPDAGPIVDQEKVPVGPNDTAFEVFEKLVPAAQRLLARCLPALLGGSARLTPMNLAAGSYFGGRRPEDGHIDWRHPAQRIHNLIRAVAPPYPGAFFEVGGVRLEIHRSFFADEPQSPYRAAEPRVYWEDGRCYAECVDGARLRIEQLVLGGRILDQAGFEAVFRTPALALAAQ